MKKTSYLLSLMVASVLLIVVSCQKTDKQPEPQTNQQIGLKSKNSCETIQGGNILYSTGHYLEGQPLQTGFDDWGYNYQALKFQDSYFNSYAGGAGFPAWDGDDATYLAANPDAANHWAWPYRNVNLMMKWNTAWISKTDCNLDGSLDRHYGYDSYIGSGAWLTNHQSGTDTLDDGTVCHWTYFVKIIAVPQDATLTDGVWYNADGTEIGPSIWGQFATIQEVYNDPCEGSNGLQYNSPFHSGLGNW